MFCRNMIGISVLALVLAGCTTYELSPAPSGHPASADATQAPAERSQTLAAAEPVETAGARSEYWAQRAQEHEHENHEHHEHMAPDAHEHENHEPEEAHEPDHDHDHDHDHEPEAVDEAAEDFDGQLAHLLSAYFETVDALADDDFETAAEKMQRVQTRLEQVDPDLLDEDQREQWDEIHEPLAEAIERFLDAPVIEAARTSYEPISKQMEQAVRTFGSGNVAPVHVVHCPMAFGNEGADWLQPYEQVNNPYYGAVMLRCGAVTETLVEEKEDADHDHDHHHDHAHDHDHPTAPGIDELPEGARTFEIEAHDMYFEPADIEVAPGEVFALTLINKGAAVHMWEIEGRPETHVHAEVGDTATGVITAPEEPGEYKTVCTEPGHTEAGMTGKLIVRDDLDPDDHDDDAHDHHDHHDH